MPHCCTACTTKAATSARGCLVAKSYGRWCQASVIVWSARRICPIDGEAHSLYLLRALHAALLQLGGEYLPGRTVDAIDAAPNSFTVRVGAERFTAAKLVIAAGLGSRELAPMVGLNMPVMPLRGQIIVTERLRPFLDYTCHTLRQTVEGTVMLGDSQEDAGFDTSIGVPVLQDIADAQPRGIPRAEGCDDRARVGGVARHVARWISRSIEQSQRYPGAFAATCHSGVTLAGAHALALGAGDPGWRIARALRCLQQRAVRCSGGLKRQRAKSASTTKAATIAARPGDSSPPHCSPPARQCCAQRRYPARRARHTA